MRRDTPNFQLVLPEFHGFVEKIEAGTFLTQVYNDKREDCTLVPSPSSGGE